MKLNKKLNFLTMVFTIITIVIISVFIKNISTKNYMQVEKMNYESKLQVLKSTIEEDFESMEYILNDWAEWDSTYKYINGLKDNYIDENIGKGVSLYEDLDLNYIIILDEDMKLLYGKYYNKDKDELNQISDKKVEIFSNYVKTTSLLAIDNKLVGFSSMQITDNEDSVKPEGLMVFARELDAVFLANLEEKTQLDLTYEIEDSNINFLKGKLNHKKGISSEIEFNIPILNIDENLTLKAVLHNEVQHLGERSLIESIIMIVIILVVFGILIDLALKKFVTNRLLNLNDQIKNIRKTTDTSKRIDINGKDEVGEVANSINFMLERIDKMHKKVKEYATYDEMTGVFNRRIGFDLIKEKIKNFANEKITFSIAYIDIDGLKKVNDKFGHAIGDKLINDSVDFLEKNINKDKDIVRLGGDEFLVILGKTNEKEANEIFDELNKKLKTQNTNSSNKYDISFSVGISEYKKNMNIDSLIESADSRMYREKKNYRCEKRDESK